MATLRKIGKFKNSKKRILFLGYDEDETEIIQKLVDKNCEVLQTKGSFEAGDYDLVISYGYRYILTEKLLDKLSCPIINLHISNISKTDIK